jgi:putative pyruvate formate lyase activating enzyme
LRAPERAGLGKPEISGELYASCSLCPRGCGVDRTGGELGFCGETHEIRAAAALLHFGEEPPITGAGGSGTVFFSGCALKCPFCQNWQVSGKGVGGPLSRGEAAGIFLGLQEAGAENINAVTGTHFAPGIIEAFEEAKARGLSIPLVWNSSGYENGETVSMVAPHVRFFLPDLKTMDAELSRRWFGAPDYPARAASAILAMADALPLIRDGDLPTQGVIMRHLVLPGHLRDTREVLRWFHDNLAGRALLSMMFQYTPIPGRTPEPPMDRMVSAGEQEQALEMLEEFSIEDGYFQEPEPDGKWLPDFDLPRPFPGTPRVVWRFESRAP